MSVAFMAGLRQELQKSQDRQMKIRAARDKKRQDDELFELKKKQIEGNLELQKKKSGKDPFLEMIEEEMNAQMKVKKAQSEVDDLSIDRALLQEQSREGKIKSTGKAVAKSLMRQRAMDNYDWSYNTGSRSFSIRPKRSSGTAEKSTDKVLGALNSGGVYSANDGGVVPFADRAEAEAYAENKLGYGWREKHPKAVDIIEEKFGIELPDTITKTSEAIDFLTENHNMTKQQAVQWIRRQNDKTIKVQ